MVNAPKTPASWRISRRNFAAAAAVFIAGVGTRISAASAHRRDHHDDGPRGNHGHGLNCFLAGTHVLTPRGEVRVELLQTGDLVTTHSGLAKPIRRIEVTSISRRANGSWLEEAIPVKVERYALGHGPHSPLYLSRHHGLFLDGLIIDVGDLVNGKTIAFAQRWAVDQLQYFNIELSEHDVLIAEGAYCESYLGDECRPYAPRFHNRNTRSRLKSRLRSAISPIMDIRTEADVIRDRLEDCAAKAA